MTIAAAFDARYFAGEYPTDPLAIKLVDYKGDPYDLRVYDSALLSTDSHLPAGVTSIVDVEQSIVHHSWSGPFTMVGRFMAQVHLISGERVDYAPPIAVEVVPPETPNPYWSNER